MIVKASLLCVLMVIGALVKSEPGPRLRSTPIYTNQFAVHVPDGPEAAAEIAAKYGFDNYGQVSGFLCTTRRGFPLVDLLEDIVRIVQPLTIRNSVTMTRVES